MNHAHAPATSVASDSHHGASHGSHRHAATPANNEVAAGIPKVGVSGVLATLVMR